MQGPQNYTSLPQNPVEILKEKPEGGVIQDQYSTNKNPLQFVG